MNQHSSELIQPSLEEIQSVQNLFTSQIGHGLSTQSSDLLVENLTPTVFAGTQGVNAFDLGQDKALLFVPVLDMTGSMAPYSAFLINAYNLMLKALQESAQADQIILSSWTFNTSSYLLHNYIPVEHVKPIDKYQYIPEDTTALYDAILNALTGLVAYSEQLRQAGATTKMSLVIFTDGNDNCSRPNSASAVKTIIKDLLAEEIYTFALVAFGGGIAIDIAKQMGIPTNIDPKTGKYQHILEVQDMTASTIRAALNTVSQSIIKQSQTIITASAGGFFNM